MKIAKKMLVFEWPPPNDILFDIYIYICIYIYIYSGNLWYSFWPGILSGVRLVPTVTTSWHTEGGEVWVGRREWDSEWVALLTKSRDPHLACGELPWKVWNSWSIASWWQIYIYMYTYVFCLNLKSGVYFIYIYKNKQTVWKIGPGVSARVWNPRPS